MNDIFTKRVIAAMEETIAKLKAGTCSLNEQEAIGILSVLAHEELSLEEACEFVNLHKSRFSELVKLGHLPKGRKSKGKRLVWYKDELQFALDDLAKYK